MKKGVLITAVLSFTFLFVFLNPQRTSANNFALDTCWYEQCGSGWCEVIACFVLGTGCPDWDDCGTPPSEQ